MQARGFCGVSAAARVAALAGMGLVAHGAMGQTITPTFRIGTTFAGCGDVFNGPRVTHSFNTAVNVHDPVSFTDDGAGIRPSSSADFTYDAMVTSTSISLNAVGHSYRGPLAPNGNGSATAASSAQDQWNFNISVPTCFSFDGSVELYVSTGAQTTSQGFQMGTNGGGAFIMLSNGTSTSLMSAYRFSSGSDSRHYTGTLSPGSYFMTVSGSAEGNGNPRTSSFNTRVALTIGPPPLTGAPASTAVCAGSAATFSAAPAPGGTGFQWQYQNGSQWVSLVDGVNTIGGQAAFDVTGARAAVVGVRSIWGLGGNLRCVLSNDCGSSTTDAATLSILSATDPACGGSPACDPDVNQDGNSDQGDVDYLINVIAGAANTTGVDPDFNQDGNADQGDVDSLVNVVAGGSCP